MLQELFAAGSIENEFEQVWTMYGRKGNKKTSMLRWVNLSRQQQCCAKEHIPKYVAATKQNPVFRKNFEVYLNQHAWEDIIFTNVPKQNYDGIKGQTSVSGEFDTPTL